MTKSEAELLKRLGLNPMEVTQREMNELMKVFSNPNNIGESLTIHPNNMQAEVARGDNILMGDTPKVSHNTIPIAHAKGGGPFIGNTDELVDYKKFQNALTKTREHSLAKRNIKDGQSLPDYDVKKEALTTTATPVANTTYDTVQNMADERASGIFGKDVKQYTSVKPELKTKSKKLQALMRILGL